MPYDILKNMGVIYKIKHDVKDFIIREKKANPRVSCRALVEHVLEKFDVTLSKSSINSILKESSLSSPVGRRASGGGSPQKKFRIPEKRKSQLLPKREEKPSFQPLPRVDINKKTKKEDMPFDEEAVLKRKTPVPLDSIKEEDVDGLGSIFLRLAQEELFGGAFLGSFLREFTKGTASMDLDAIGDILLFLKPFGINSISELDQYNQKGLGFVLDVKQKIDSASLTNVLNGIQDIRSMAIRLLIEIKQRTQLIKGIKVGMEDLSEIYLDPRLYSVWEGNVQSDFFVSLNVAMEIMIKGIIENVQSVMLKSPYLFARDKRELSAALPEAFVWFVQAMEGALSDKRIRKIAAFDINDQELVSFDVIPPKKRKWMCGVWPGQGLYDDLKQVKVRKCQKVDLNYARDLDVLGLSADIFEGQIRFRASLPNMTVLEVKKKDGEVPACFVLTNAGQSDNLYRMASQYICSWYQAASGPWDNFSCGGAVDFSDFLGQKADAVFANCLESSLCDKNVLFDWVFNIIHEYAKIRFFIGNKNPLVRYIENIYSKSGNCEVADNLLLLHFKSSQSLVQSLSPYPGQLPLDNKNIKIL